MPINKTTYTACPRAGDGFKAGPRSFEYKVELLSSYMRRLESNDLYFVSVQPNTTLWTEIDCQQYAAELMPGITASYVLMPEQNDRTSRKGRIKTYELDPTLHFHMVLPAEALRFLLNPVIYRNKSHLENLKRENKGRFFHIVACKIYNEHVPTYLSKQAFENGFIPVFCTPSLVLPQQDFTAPETSWQEDFDSLTELSEHRPAAILAPIKGFNALSQYEAPYFAKPPPGSRKQKSYCFLSSAKGSNPRL